MGWEEILNLFTFLFRFCIRGDFIMYAYTLNLFTFLPVISYELLSFLASPASNIKMVF